MVNIEKVKVGVAFKLHYVFLSFSSLSFYFSSSLRLGHVTLFNICSGFFLTIHTHTRVEIKLKISHIKKSLHMSSHHWYVLEGTTYVRDLATHHKVVSIFQIFKKRKKRRNGAGDSCMCHLWYMVDSVIPPHSSIFGISHKYYKLSAMKKYLTLSNFF